MRSSIFTVPAGSVADTLTVNSPDTVFPADSFTVTAGYNSLTITINATGATQRQLYSYIGRTATFAGGSGSAEVSSVGIITGGGAFPTCTITFTTVFSSASLVVFPQTSLANDLPTGTRIIPVGSTIGVNVGEVVDVTSNTAIAVGTVIAAVGTTVNAAGQTVPAVTLNLGITRNVVNGETFTLPSQPGVVVYPVDQYIAPVEISIQQLTTNTGSGSVSVFGTVLPLSEIDNVASGYRVWSAYNFDGGNTNQIPNPSTSDNRATLVTFSDRIITAIRIENTYQNAVTLSLAEAGIIS